MERAAAACFVLYCLLPLISGLVLPFMLGLARDPTASLAVRTIILLATGGASFLIALLPVPLCVRHPLSWRIYTFLLLPIAATCLITQAIMYREFGTEIDDHLVGLFQGNAAALWVFAREKYHIDWAIAALVACAAAVSWWISRDQRFRWLPSPRILGGLFFLFLASASLGLGMKPDIRHQDHYHPVKLAEAPLLQLLSFTGERMWARQTSGYRGILNAVEEVAVQDDRVEIEKRLGDDIGRFCLQRVSSPSWLRKRPSHVFLFLLESVEYELLVNPELTGLVPRLADFARSGLLIREFHPPSGSTIDSVHAMISGAASQDRYPVPRTLARVDEIDTLPRLMERAGYKPVFLAASRRHLADKGDACEAYGYARFIGCPDVAPEIRSNEWGVSDGAFFQWARKELADLEAPHFVTFLNVSNHVPYDAPLGDLPGPPPSEAAVESFIGTNREERARYAGHVRYADEMMGQMALWLRETYPDSLFVFVADHCGNKLRRGSNGRVPLVLWNDRVVDPRVDTSEWFGSHMDIPATLASMVLPEGDTYRTLGRPVWDLNENRVSPAGSLIISANGIVERKPSAAETSKLSPAARARALRCSAIDALSWGFLNDSPLGPSNPGGD